MQKEIQNSADDYQKKSRTKDLQIVGGIVTIQENLKPDILKVDEALGKSSACLKKIQSEARDAKQVDLTV
ncbi:MAG: hypothetical protein H7A33_05610 [Deltaproteobacteria bacterium]|nr:hypothetical protein [Deltaproteobacteria bacterium]